MDVHCSRSVLGYINQEPVLFARSVAENIRYGRPEATDEEVIEAAKQANAHEFINSFPQGGQSACRSSCIFSYAVLTTAHIGFYRL